MYRTYGIRAMQEQRSGVPRSCALSPMVKMFLIFRLTAFPLTARDTKRTHLSTTITRMDAGVEPPGRALPRVNAGCVRVMSRITATQIQACYISLFR